MAKPQVVKTSQEREFKAKWWHARDCAIKSKFGEHAPEKHLNRFEVAPVRQADGKTFCPKCNLSFVGFDDLPEQTKDQFRAMAEAGDQAQSAWEANG